MKVLPLILSGLAAVSFSVFAQTSPKTDNDPTVKSNKDAVTPAAPAEAKGSASVGASGDKAATGDKPKAKKAKVKKSKDAKASSGSSAPKAEEKAAADQSSKPANEKPASSAGSPGGK